VSKPEVILENIRIDKRTAFVLMTHNYHYDLAVLKLLLPKEELRYIGILGPKVKYMRMLEDLHKLGISPTEMQLSRIFAPVGLDLGTETSAEIALSILSEVQAVLTSSSASNLRNKQGPIHKKKHNNFKVVKL
jgi:xanthine/CO dehydrogenase XdhC/CoxF family maturation factor